MTDQQPVPEAKLTIPATALLDIRTTLMPNGLAWAAAEFAYHSRDAEVAELKVIEDWANDPEDGMLARAREVAELQRQLENVKG